MTKRGRAPTLKSIADDLGLHVSTVARVLNDGARDGERVASGETAQRIRERALEVNYRPNLYASSLRTQRTNVIGVLVPRLTDMVLATVYEGIESAANEHAMIAFVANTQDDAELQSARIQMMIDRRVDGLILGDVRSDDPVALEGIEARSLPYVLVNRGVPNHPSSTCDNYLGGRIAAEHLIDLGHTNVGIIAGLAHASTGIDRPAGFVARYREEGIEIPNEHILYTGLDSAGGHTAADAFLAMQPRPTALFAVNDFAALGAIGAIRDHGLTVGRDVSLIGFNNTSLAGEMTVPLTSVESHPDLMGRAAVDMIIKRIAGEPVEDFRTTPTLVARQSTQPVPR